MLIRDETPGDIPAIGRVITSAMLLLPQSTGTEARIVEALRADGELTLSLVAEDAGEVVGHLAASMAQIGPMPGWALIGPLVVTPKRHRQGIGSVLMQNAISRLRETCLGAVLVGDPGYYARFGFQAHSGLGLDGVPSEFVQALAFDGTKPVGNLTHHPAFSQP